MATHGVLSRPGHRPAEELGRSSKVVVTNTLPLPPEKQIDKIEVLSVAALIADAIDAVFEDTWCQRDLRRREPGLTASVGRSPRSRSIGLEPSFEDDGGRVRRARVAVRRGGI